MPKLDDSLFILGLDSCESRQDLKSAYRREMHRWHPDRHQRDPVMLQAANERTRLINAAYERLSKNFESGAPGAFNDAQCARPGKPRYTRKKKAGGRAPIPRGFPDPSVTEIFVSSSNIASAGYNPAKAIFFLKFRDRSIYGYFDVPEEVFARFIQADSHGRFANHHVFNCYRSERFN
jgi:curved DNA-binding protein CbpA